MPFPHFRPIIKRTIMASADSKVHDFIAAMQRVYSFPKSPTETTQKWSPPPASAGHRGRYLWTDAFGVLNLVTLSRLTPYQSHYLTLAGSLVEAVHSTLGRTRDLSSQLPGATPENPMGGGLRIGKDDATGPDGDGQYFHYLTLWMFALNRLSVASKKREYNDQAIALARAIHPAFMYERQSSRPRMVWKMSMDLSHVLVHSEGNLDPIDGLVTFRLLQQTDGPESTALSQEIGEYEKIVRSKVHGYSSSDPLDLGMTLWTSHWLAEEEGWARMLLQKATRDLGKLFEKGYFERDIRRRLAFREFGTAMGIRCAKGEDEGWIEKADLVTAEWRDAGLLEGTGLTSVNSGKDLQPITLVMYAAAMIPGGELKYPCESDRLANSVDFAAFGKSFLNE